MSKNTYVRIISTLTISFSIIFALSPMLPLFAYAGEGELLLKFKPEVGSQSKASVFASLGLEVADEIPEVGILVVRTPQNALQNVKSALSHNPTIDFVEENRWCSPSQVPNDQYYGFQWHLTKIEASAAWDITIGNPNVAIAVLDSGVDTSHPDLAARMLAGWNFYDNTNNVTDITGHGTAVAGVVAAVTNNSLGVASIAWGCSILPVRVADPSGYATYSSLSKGLVYAADKGAKVAVVSFGIYGGSALSSAAKYFMDKGGLVFAAGGNTGAYVSDSDNPYIISVSGTTSSDQSWGSYGPYIDLSAPCSGIYTTLRGGGYGNVGGTSFSAPLAAGLAALVFSANPSLAPSQVEQILESSAVDLGDRGYDTHYGWGRINASAALSRTLGKTPVSDTTPPTVVVASPADGSTVSGDTIVKVDAIDDVSVSKVELYKDGALFASKSNSPFEFPWDTTNSPSGVHKLVAKAYDASNNIGVSNSVTVCVSNPVDNTPPTVIISNPSNSARVSGFVNISVSATDSSGVNRVEFYVDGQLKSTVNTVPYVYRWNAKSAKTGLHTISVKAYDAFGNFAIASVEVYVSK